MKKFFVITLAIVFMCLFVSYWTMADVRKDLPIAVSPGSEQEASAVSEVGQICPTFSWSAVDNASSYRVTVFMTDEAKVASYEEMMAKTTPVLNKDIPGPALSWTLSSEEGLKTGTMYAWYVQAIDAYGNAASGWSKGRIFKVKQEAVWVGIEEKLGQKMKEYGVNDEVIKNVMADINSEVKEVVVQTPGSNTPVSSNNIGRLKSLEDTYNTFFGLNAGSSITSGIFDTFIGSGSGYSNTTANWNSFIGYSTGYYNTTGGANLFAGTYAGYQNSTGGNNTFLGAFSGDSNTSGHDNVFIGYGNGSNNTTGTQNTFIGANSGAMSTGSQNTFLGCYSGFNNTANYCTFLGYYAGYNNTSGSHNCFIGDYTGYNNTTGTKNTFIGSEAGNYNSTGYYNTFVGYGSGGANGSGVCNSFFGYNAGTYMSNGSYNTYLGYNSGLRNSTGGNNIAIGNCSAYNNTSGNSNTIIGTFAGYNSSGSGNVFLGNGAGYSETGSDKLYIENSTGASPLIYGDFSTNILKINGSLGVGISPIYPLDMASGAHCTTGGVWTNASSRSLKENIHELSTRDALEALNQLTPVRYNYKVDKTDECLGFIAEDVPELVATADRKSLSPMDITAVLTKVVQELRKENEEYRKLITDLQERLAKIEKNE